MLYASQILIEGKQSEGRVENLIIVGEDEQRQVWKQQLLPPRSFYHDGLGASNIFAIMCR